jgi:hypothetical protein
MKKALILVVIVATSFDGFSQAGSWYVGGVVGYASSSEKIPGGNTTSTSSWALGPEAGTFLKDDIQLGLVLGIGGSSQKDDGGDIYSISTLTPTVYGRKFFKITDNFSTFAGLYLNFLSGSQTNYTGGGGSNEIKQSGFGFRVGVGVAYALSPRFTAVGQYGLLGYTSVTSKFNGNETDTTSSFDFGVNTTGSNTLSQGNGSGAVFNIGIYYTFKTAQ